MTPPCWSGDGVEDSEEWLGRSMDCITVSIYLKRLLLIAATTFSDFAHYCTTGYILTLVIFKIIFSN